MDWSSHLEWMDGRSLSGSGIVVRSVHVHAGPALGIFVAVQGGDPYGPRGWDSLEPAVSWPCFSFFREKGDFIP